MNLVLDSSAWKAHDGAPASRIEKTQERLAEVVLTLER